MCPVSWSAQIIRLPLAWRGGFAHVAYVGVLNGLFGIGFSIVFLASSWWALVLTGIDEAVVVW